MRSTKSRGVVSAAGTTTATVTNKKITKTKSEKRIMEVCGKPGWMVDRLRRIADGLVKGLNYEARAYDEGHARYDLERVIYLSKKVADLIRIEEGGER